MGWSIRKKSGNFDSYFVVAQSSVVFYAPAFDFYPQGESAPDVNSGIASRLQAAHAYIKTVCSSTSRAHIERLNSLLSSDNTKLHQIGAFSKAVVHTHKTILAACQSKGAAYSLDDNSNIMNSKTV